MLLAVFASAPDQSPEASHALNLSLAVSYVAIARTLAVRNRPQACQIVTCKFVRGLCVL